MTVLFFITSLFLRHLIRKGKQILWWTHTRLLCEDGGGLPHMCLGGSTWLGSRAQGRHCPCSGLTMVLGCEDCDVP